ncbi:protein LTO1 homolog isoform X1 [Polyodon spathula]|uniref:protein LTO1 homolog isoform X1 n=1 Tax=Polyodon spathula TaxID=7913 RepID=UPI001B7DA288|nr:protein LTO1 homolog isoform X1 [Polyodon spathula]
MASVSGSDDLFDTILLADNRFRGEGYQEGYEEGSRVGIIEGRSHGSLHGAKIAGEEPRRVTKPKVAFYYGFAFTWKCLLQNSTDAKASKRLKTLESLISIIQSFPHEDPTYEKLQEDVERVRAKFRQTCSLLNVPADFKDCVNQSGMSF